MSCKEEKIKYLSSYRWCQADIESDREKLLALESKLYSPASASLSGMPKSGKGFEIEHLLTMKDDLKKRISSKVEKMNAITNAVESVEDPRYRLLLKLIYIDCYSQSAAAEAMNYCTKHINRLLKVAIDVFEIPEEYTIPPDETA